MNASRPLVATSTVVTKLQSEGTEWPTGPAENGGEKLVHGSGGMELLRAA